MAQRPLPGDLRRPVIASSAAVVTCFVLATAFAEYRTRLGAHPAIDLASTTLPRIELLASTALQLQDRSDAIRWQDPPCTHEPCLSAPALSAMSRRVGETIGREQREVIQAIRAEASFAGVEAQRLARARRRRMFLVIVLDSISVLMAVILTRLALRAAVARQRFNEERSDELEIFASRVAHDILNPVAAAEMSVLMAIRRGDAHDRSSLQCVVRSLRRARSIADALLDFARAGARPSPGAATGVREAISDAIADVDAEARASGIEIIAGRIADAEVACSRGALASILGNLLANSVRYMGASIIRRVFVRSEPVQCRVRFEVEDTGPGLPQSREKSLFEPFVRGDNASGSGIGLGLATVKRLVEAHGGSIRATMGEAGGCLIEFELPEMVRPRLRLLPSASQTDRSAASLP